MDVNTVREHADIHAQAVKSGDMKTAGSYLTKDSAAQAGEVMPHLPKNVVAAQVLSVEPQEERFVVHIHYAGTDEAGADKEGTVESFWLEKDGRPRLVEMAILRSS